jgi:hypothetical protein
MAKVAEVLVQTLIEAGVKRVYWVAGDSLNGMTETIRKSDDPPLAARVVPIPQAGANEPPIVRIAVSLATLSAYLREDVLLDLNS